MAGAMIEDAAASTKTPVFCDAKGAHCAPKMYGSWAMQVVAAIILGQTLFFKFSGAEEPVYIFTTLGAEPWGRLGSAVVELIAVVLLLTPRLAIFGAALALGTMFGAIGAHLGPLGIVVKDDGGLLFGLAIVTLACALGVLWLRRRQVQRAIKSPKAYVLGRA